MALVGRMLRRVECACEIVLCMHLVCLSPPLWPFLALACAVMG